MNGWAIAGITGFVVFCLVGMFAEGNPFDDGPNWPNTGGQ